MKKVNVYTIFDSASGEFGLPFFSVNDLVAQRQTCITLSSLPVNYWKDFQLIQIGRYESDKGEIYPLDENIVVSDGKDLINVFENMYKESK